MKDKYGLEYPWRSRSLINLIPKPLKRLLKNQINHCVRVLEGMLEGVAPKKVLVWMQGQAIRLLSIAKEKTVAYIKTQMEKKPSVNGGNNSEEISQKKTARNQQLEVAVTEDYDIDVEVSEDQSVLASA